MNPGPYLLIGWCLKSLFIFFALVLKADFVRPRYKVNKVTGTEPGAAPSIMEVTDDDVDFVMAEADLDKNGTLDKEEVRACGLA